MKNTRSSLPDLIAGRRSIRAFTDTPVDRACLEDLVMAACLAPAPHHSRPWRFALVVDDGWKRRLADAMADRWREDLAADGVDDDRIATLTTSSIERLSGAPALVVGCLTDAGLDRYPDGRRSEAEWGMARLSLGAAIENLLLAATDQGLGACLIAAPIFCPETTRAALDLPGEWIPQALAMIGHVHPGYRPPDRTPIDLAGFVAVR